MSADFGSVGSARRLPAHRVGAAEPRGSDPYLGRAIALTAMFVLILPAILAVMVVTQPEPPLPRWALEAVALGVQTGEITRGEAVFGAACSVCHGAEGQGVPLLGKPLRNSAFVQSQTDEQLLTLLVEGRAVSDPLNTSGALMPPRGAQGVDDGSLARVVTYLRAIQDEGAPVASVEAWNIKGGRSDGAALAAIQLDTHAGYDLFVASCAACHGQGAEGIEGLGLPLSTSGFVRGQSDKDLITFIKSGRASWDENNTTGLDMPPKGGNPAITDQDLQLIADYLRAVQEEAMGS